MAGKDVTELCINYLNSGVLPKDFNLIHIVLIPKKQNLEEISGLRPIKAIVKTLANIMKAILPDMILDTQYAFVLGHLISDNILIAFEIDHRKDRARPADHRLRPPRVQRDESGDHRRGGGEAAGPGRPAPPPPDREAARLVPHAGRPHVSVHRPLSPSAPAARARRRLPAPPPR